MKRNVLNQEESSLKYQSMGSLLAANYYKEKYAETKDPSYLEKYKAYTQQLERYKQIEKEQTLMRLRRKINRCTVIPMMIASIFLTSIFSGFFQKEEVQRIKEVKAPEPVQIIHADTPELEESLPKGYREFPLKTESQISTPVKDILAKREQYARSSLAQEVYADLSKIFRNALYQYVKANDGKFPKTIAPLPGKLPRNYLSGIPRDPYYYSNQIKEEYDGTGGWVYDSSLGEMALAETESLIAATSMALNCNADCGQPSFSPLQVTIVKGKHQLIVHTDNQIFATYPVALGETVTQTPEGKFHVKRKLAYPRSDLKQSVNPYGSRLIELSDDDYAIHGTPQEKLLGKNVSKGCIRMKNADIIELFSYISIGTPIQIVERQSENKTLVRANRSMTKNDYKTLTPSPMVLSTSMIQNIMPVENAGDSNHGEGNGDGGGEGNGDLEDSGNAAQPKPSEQPPASNPSEPSEPKQMPDSLLPKIPRPNEQSGETRKWKD